MLPLLTCRKAWGMSQWLQCGSAKPAPNHKRQTLHERPPRPTTSAHPSPMVATRPTTRPASCRNVKRCRSRSMSSKFHGDMARAGPLGRGQPRSSKCEALATSRGSTQQPKRAQVPKRPGVAELTPSDFMSLDIQKNLLLPLRTLADSLLCLQR